MSQPLKIAVIGSGISGLSAAWLLSKSHDVTLFEREQRAGGHSNTVEIDHLRANASASPVAVDTGFIVYNTKSYPNLIALFDHLDVPTATTSMSFAVSLDGGGYEYSGTGLSGIFGQPTNLLSPSHWLMIRDILRFFRESRQVLADPSHQDISLGDYLIANGYSPAFIARHIQPMAAAIWSTPSADVLAFPAASFVRFFDNHGLLQINQPEWRTVAGGSREYVNRVLADTDGRIEIARPVEAIRRLPVGMEVTAGGATQSFDACVVATHADTALELLADADHHEHRLLGAFRYAPNTAVLHTDPGFMPRRKRLWSSWNYLTRGEADDTALSVTYWMNNLQPLATSQNLFVTLNPDREISPDHVAASFNYAHPMFDQAAMSAQRELWGLQGRRNTWFCGSHFGYGFHEDGIQAGLAVAEDIGDVRRPWRVRDESGRIQLSSAPRLPVDAALETAA